PAAYDLSPNPQKPYKAGIARVEGTGYLELIAQWDRENRARRAEQEAQEKQKDGEAPPLEEQEPPPQRGVDPKGVSNQAPPAGQTISLAKALEGPVAEPPKPPPPEPDVLAQVKERSPIDVTDRPTFLLTLDQAAELAMFNSREFQDQRENLYLSALPVTQERFSFMAQFFAAEEAVRTYAGRDTPGGRESSWALNSGTGFSKLLPTGALLLLNFSNQTVFNFLSPKKTTSITDLNFAAIQPLLRGGGKAVALEPLTLVERNLLYQV